MFPFVIASTFRTSNVNDNFKPEYIIPQLMLQLVKDRGYKLNNKGVYGIKYTSVHCGKESEHDDYSNYAIPVLSIKDEYCRRLAAIFEFTDPICFDELIISNNNSEYNSLFEAMEGKLNESETKVIFDSTEQ